MNLLNKVIIVIIFTVAVYSTFIITSDITTISEKISNIEIEFFIIIGIFVTLGWLILFARWHLLLKNSNISIPIKSSFLVYMSGFALSMIPGEAGDLIKVQILKNKFNVSRSKTSGIIFSEWLYTAIGLISLSLTGVIFFELGGQIAIIFLILLISLISIIKSRKLFFKFSKLVSKIKYLSNFTKNIEESYSVIQESTKGKIAIISILLSLSFWILESILVYFIINKFGINQVEIFELISMYASAIILGFVSFLPLGTGVVEISLASFLNQKGIELSIAFSIIIVIRLLTRWYPVMVGFIAIKKMMN
jgi:glycosyltransferase 2 family protein